MIFVDSNIIIDLVDRSGRWSDWSRSAMGEAAKRGSFVSNAIVAAESAPRFSSVEEQVNYFDAIGVTISQIPVAAAFCAGQAHQRYRRAGGAREAVLADFLIGGHASVLAATLLTRDRARFATYFPDLPIITPETHP